MRRYRRGRQLDVGRLPWPSSLGIMRVPNLDEGGAGRSVPGRHERSGCRGSRPFWVRTALSMGKFATGQLLVFGVALAGPGQEIEPGKAVPEPAWVLCQRGCQPLDGCRDRAITSARKRLGRLPSRAQKAGMRPDLTAHLTATASGRGEPSDAACPAAG